MTATERHLSVKVLASVTLFLFKLLPLALLMLAWPTLNSVQPEVY